MGCFITDEEGGGKAAVLAFKRDELIYDIANGAYIEGNVLPEEISAHNRHWVQDVAQKGNIDRATRVLNLEIAKVREALYPFTNHEITNAELNNKLREPHTYGIVMKLPADFSQTTLNYLELLIHEYLVCRVLEDWMSMTNPGKTELWGLKAERALDELRSSRNRRKSGTVRRKLRPW